MLNTFAIRLKRHPDVFVGKQHVSYALKSDAKIAECAKYRPQDTIDQHLGVDAHWFKPAKHAQVWTDPVCLRRLMSYCSEGPNDTFSEYEVIHNGVVKPLDSVKSIK